MKWGLIARSETDRGLGIQTLAMYQNLKPDATLIIDVPLSGFASHVENYGPESWKVTLSPDGQLPEDVVREWWSDLDVVVSVETLYDWRLVEWGHADGVRTVVHGNPEFWIESNPQPDVWWWPTTWRLDHLPAGKVVPVPVPDERVANVAGDPSQPLRALHIAGNRAMADRNGSGTILEALRGLDLNITLTAYSQAGHQGYARKQRRQGQFVEHGPVEDRWTMYAGHHVLVLPRRYGGLCLPALEAMASGLAVLMPDCDPNFHWPILRLAAVGSRTVQMQTGPVATVEVYPNTVRNELNRLNVDKVRLRSAMEASREWAEANRWSVLASLYHDEIEAAASR